MEQLIEAPACQGRNDTTAMFDRIAPRYDLLNRVLSFRRDTAWRRRMGRHLPGRTGQHVLDLATGTADVLIGLCRGTDKVSRGAGLDLSANMLAHGRTKILHARLQDKLTLLRGDACRLGFADASFDAVTMAFGIRNVADVPGTLREIRRVLRTHGRALILEFSLPRNALVRVGYLAYFRYVLPRIGGLVSGDTEAYRYLNRSVEGFPHGEAFCALLREAGFAEVKAFPLTFGIATLYQGDTGS